MLMELALIQIFGPVPIRCMVRLVLIQYQHQTLFELYDKSIVIAKSSIRSFWYLL